MSDANPSCATHRPGSPPTITLLCKIRASAAVFLALSSVATPAGAQMTESYALPLPHDPARWAEAASVIRGRGLSCPEVKSMAVVGHDTGGDNYRVDCGPVHGPADPTMIFRLRSGGEAGFRVEPWN
jgi:hypothetical protein